MRNGRASSQWNRPTGKVFRNQTWGGNNEGNGNEKMHGDRNCNKLCPEVFEYNEDELKSIVKLDPIPDKYKELVLQAARECGADAIEIVD